MRFIAIVPDGETLSSDIEANADAVIRQNGPKWDLIKNRYDKTAGGFSDSDVLALVNYFLDKSKITSTNPPVAQKWEYDSITAGPGPDLAHLTDDLGRDGWELVAVCATGYKSREHVAYLKRLIS